MALISHPGLYSQLGLRAIHILFHHHSHHHRLRKYCSCDIWWPPLLYFLRHRWHPLHSIRHGRYWCYTCLPCHSLVEELQGEGDSTDGEIQDHEAEAREL